MKLRRATEADAGSIARVHILAWQEAYRGILPDEFLAALSLQRRTEMWAAHLADPDLAPGLFVVADEDQVVGFASAGPARQATLGYNGELYAIYLLAAHQGKGFGRALFSAAAHSLHHRALNSMMLWVLKENPTHGFYDHLGGRAFSEQVIEIGAKQYSEVAYGWPELDQVL